MNSQEPRLLVVQGPIAGKIIPLTADVLTVGRAGDNHIVIADDAVSRHHAQITRLHTQYYIADLHSRNGTFVNNVELEADKPHCLEHGDQIQIAASAAVLRFEDPQATRPLDKSTPYMGLVIDPERRQVRLEGKQLAPPLSPQQFKFLLLLYQRAGKVCARDEIVAEVWADMAGETVSEEMIDALAARIRKRLRELNPTHEYIVTVRGHGFKFAPG